MLGVNRVAEDVASRAGVGPEPEKQCVAGAQADLEMDGRRGSAPRHSSRAALTSSPTVQDADPWIKCHFFSGKPLLTLLPVKSCKVSSQIQASTNSEGCFF